MEETTFTAGEDDLPPDTPTAELFSFGPKGSPYVSEGRKKPPGRNFMNEPRKLSMMPPGVSELDLTSVTSVVSSYGKPIQSDEVDGRQNVALSFSGDSVMSYTPPEKVLSSRTLARGLYDICKDKCTWVITVVGIMIIIILIIIPIFIIKRSTV